MPCKGNYPVNMQLHILQREHQNRRSVQVGRGGKRGKTSGRGGKGQTARAGAKVRPALRDVIMKLPKRRGYRFKSIEERAIPVNLSALEKYFSAGEEVSPAALIAKGLLRTRSGKIPPVKILSSGTLTKALRILGCRVSAAARKEIERAGGKVT